MKLPFYPDAQPPVEIPEPSPPLQQCPYLPDEGLQVAVNVALYLGQPLLLTGEPGTGKTQLAYHLAAKLGLGEPLKFEAKSVSTARDLFYIYDALGRFHAAEATVGVQVGANLSVRPTIPLSVRPTIPPSVRPTIPPSVRPTIPPSVRPTIRPTIPPSVRPTIRQKRTVDYITYNALGQAIMLTKPKAEVAPYLPPQFVHSGPKRSVVLIDEIDKAPRDFPNDILNEVEAMYFRIPELDNITIEADPHYQPILVITSNSEKSLPDAFLRRCVYYNIPFPDEEHLEKIVDAHLENIMPSSNQQSAEVFTFFFTLREPSKGLHKKPSTAELLNWLNVLHGLKESAHPLKESNIAPTLSLLAKTEADQKTVLRLFREFF